MPYEAPSDLSGLSLGEIAALVAARKLPPVASWQPEKSGDSEMRITADGRWYHQGGEITRPAMIRAFSTLLRCDENGSHYLVTPQEKLSIIVDDAPFLAVELKNESEGENRNLAFRLNDDSLILCGKDHPLVLRGADEAALPYVHVRSGLYAKIARPVYYELFELTLQDAPLDQYKNTIYSGGIKFQIGPEL